VLLGSRVSLRQLDNYALYKTQLRPTKPRVIHNGGRSVSVINYRPPPPLLVYCVDNISDDRRAAAKFFQVQNSQGNVPRRISLTFKDNTRWSNGVC